VGPPGRKGDCGTAVSVRLRGDADPAGLATAAEDDPLAPGAGEPGRRADQVRPRVHVRAEPGPASPRPDRGRLHPDLRRQAAGKTVGRPELAACPGCLRAGDTLVVPGLDRLSRSLPDLITIVAGLRAAAPGSGPCTRRWTPPPRAAGWSSTSSRTWPSSSGDSSWRGSRCSAPRPGSTARQRRCWPGLPRTGRPGPRRSRRPAPGARCGRRPRAHATSDARLSGWYGGRPRHSLICCWMTSGAGRASTV
jgi:Resolvase, N terminal domain